MFFIHILHGIFSLIIFNRQINITVTAIRCQCTLHPRCTDKRIGEPKRAGRLQDVHLSRKFQIMVKTFLAVSICVIG